jgi:hypothetical protein
MVLSRPSVESGTNLQVICCETTKAKINFSAGTTIGGMAGIANLQTLMNLKFDSLIVAWQKSPIR